MRAEVIAIGDEMTTGQRIDTNSQWLSSRLNEQGIYVAFHTTVGDILADNVAVFKQAISRAEVIVVTGGLGPTADDLTREALASATGRPLELNPAALAHIEQLFARYGRRMPERNRLQAMFPAGSRPIDNPDGTAPGIQLELPADAARQRPTVYLFALPGVPAEMRLMWEQTVAPRLRELTGGARVIRHRVIKCFGIGESRMEELLPEMIARTHEPLVGITVHGATISLRITAGGATPEEALAAMDATAEKIYRTVGTLAFGEGDDELENAVARLLAAQGKTLATAESGSGGRLAHWMTATPEAGDVYRGGLVAADQSRFATSDTERRQLAIGGAEGARQQFGADFGLAVSPMPPAGEDEAPGDYFYALASDKETIVRAAITAGHPSILKDRAAKQALDLLRLELLRLANPGNMP